jgi:hypothetical protein
VPTVPGGGGGRTDKQVTLRSRQTDKDSVVTTDGPDGLTG